MRLSTIIELLLIFLLIAFAAYGRVIVPEGHGRAIGERKSASALRVTAAKQTGSGALKQAAENVNKYCVCSDNICNCCRDFHIPLVQLSGPGCASLQYLQDEKLAMQLSIGDNILSSNIVNGKNPKPVCVALPGGFSKFCGKVYSIKREADKHFKACLGLELRSASELEASLRVSCFRFGPDGLKLRPAEPLPALVTEASTTSDDDYEDLFGLDEDDEDDEDDDDEDEQKISPEGNALAGAGASEAEAQESEPEDEDEEDLLDFSGLFDIFGGDDEPPKKKPAATTSTALPPSFAIPILSLTSTHRPPVGSVNNAAATAPVSKRPSIAAGAVATSTTNPPAPNKAALTTSATTSSRLPDDNKPAEENNATGSPRPAAEQIATAGSTDVPSDEYGAGSEKTDYALSPDTTDYPLQEGTGTNLEQDEGANTTPADADAAAAVTELDGLDLGSTDAEPVNKDAASQTKPDATKLTATAPKKPANFVKKTSSLPSKKKLTVTSQSVNAIKNEVKPQQQQSAVAAAAPAATVVDNEDNDDDDDDDDEEEEDEEEDYNSEAEGENDEAEDSDEEETAVSHDEEHKEQDGEKGDKKKVTAAAAAEADKNEQADDNDEEEEDDDDEDESEEEEDAVLSALVSDDDDDDKDDKPKKKKKIDKTPSDKTAPLNDDYSDELVDLLARQHQESRTVGRVANARKTRGRQSKDMRF